MKTDFGEITYEYRIVFGSAMQVEDEVNRMLNMENMWQYNGYLIPYGVGDVAQPMSRGVWSKDD
jgi:hypothetical protein